MSVSLPPSSHRSIQSFTTELNDIETQMKHCSKIMGKWFVSSQTKKAAKTDYEDLRTRLIDISFQAKLEHPEFEMPEIAKKVHQIAMEITEGTEQDILKHGEEYAFLTSRSHLHYFDKHILTLRDWQNTDKSKIQSSKLIIDQEGVKLRTYSDEGCKHLSVSDLMQESKEDPELVFELTYFDLNRRKKNEVPTELKPTFQTRSDNKYHVSIVTDCPDGKMTAVGCHTWMRLTDKDGKVYSIGKFPEDLKLPFLFRKEAVLFSTPDSHEWLRRKGAVKEHSFEITEEHFNHLKTNIEEDLKDAPNADFNVFGESCSDWAIDKLAKIGIEIKKRQARVDQFTILFPGLSELYEKHISLKIRSRYTDHIRKVISIATLQIARIGLAFLFGGIDRNKKNKTSKPFFKSPKDLIKPDLTELIHPFKLRQYLDRESKNIQKKYNKKPQSQAAAA